MKSRLKVWIAKLATPKLQPATFTECYFQHQLPGYTARRLIPFLLLVGVRLIVHYFRYHTLMTHYPWFDMNPLIDLILILQVFETVFSGLLENLRDRARSQEFKQLVAVVRQWNTVAFFAVIGIFIYMGSTLVFPLLTTDRVFSVFDLIKISFLVKTAFDLLLLPEQSFLQGHTRLHYFKGAFFLQELFSLLALVVCSFYFVFWGVAVSLVLDHFFRMAVRGIVLAKTKRDLQYTYRSLKCRRPELENVFSGKSFISALGCCVLAVGARIENLILMKYFHSEAEDGAFLYLPLLKAAGDPARLFIFDLMSQRKRISQILGRVFIPKVFLISICSSVGFFFCFLLFDRSSVLESTAGWFSYFMVCGVATPFFIFLTYAWLRWIHPTSVQNVYAGFNDLKGKPLLIKIQTRRNSDANQILKLWRPELEKHHMSVFRYQKGALILASIAPVSETLRLTLLEMARGHILSWKKVEELKTHRDEQPVKNEKGDQHKGWMIFDSSERSNYPFTRLQTNEIVSLAVSAIESGVTQKYFKWEQKKYRVLSTIDRKGAWITILIPAGEDPKRVHALEEQFFLNNFGFILPQ